MIVSKSLVWMCDVAFFYLVPMQNLRNCLSYFFLNNERFIHNSVHCSQVSACYRNSFEQINIFRVITSRLEREGKFL